MTFPRQSRRRFGPGSLHGAHAVAVTGLAFVAVLAGCGSVGQASPTVRVLPDSTVTPTSWTWTASCPFTPVVGSVCRSASPKIGSAQLAGDEWNLGDSPGSPGTVGMSVESSGSLVVRGDLTDAPPCTDSDCLAPSADTWVRGYPSVLYGIDQCNANTSVATSPNFQLPARVSAIPPDLVGSTTYSADPAETTYDIAYDMWLNPSSTRTPCRTSGTIEVMVWTGYDDRALLPASLQIATASSPFEIDGTDHSGAGAWSVYANNVYRDDQTAPWGGTFWFVLNKNDAVDRGTVNVDLSSVLAAVGNLLQHDYGWTGFERSYWLDTIPFGMEFGPSSGALTGEGSSRFSLRVESFCLDTDSTVSTAAC
jgi:Glycosyl hydrolase family 12